MGNSLSMTSHNINFEDMQSIVIENHLKNEYMIINTLDPHQQTCLIAGTLNISSEIDQLNQNLKNNKDIRIVIYGMNAADTNSLKKYDQLIKLGFYYVYIYSGGLFEWLLLQDIYGPEMFPTTVTKDIDFLKYKGKRTLNMKLLEN